MSSSSASVCRSALLPGLVRSAEQVRNRIQGPVLGVVLDRCAVELITLDDRGLLRPGRRCEPFVRIVSNGSVGIHFIGPVGSYGPGKGYAGGTSVKLHDIEPSGRLVRHIHTLAIPLKLNEHA